MSHPNIKLHNALLQAAKDGKLDAECVRRCCDQTSLPDVGRNASAYVNWNATVTLLGAAPAQSWFAGVSRPPFIPGANVQSFAQPIDKLRDDLSVGTNYHYSINNVYSEGTYFVCEVIEPLSLLFIDVFSNSGEFINVFVGSATMNVQIQGGTWYFEGNGTWSHAMK